MSLDGRIDLNIKFDQVDASLTQSAELADLVDQLSLTLSDAFTFGTGPGQVNTFWHDTRILAGGGGAEILDFFSGLVDPSTGQAISFTEIKLFYVRVTGDGVLLLHTFAALGVTKPWLDFYGADQSQVFRTSVYLRYDIGGGGIWQVDVDERELGFQNQGGFGNDISYDIVVVGVGTRS